MRGRSAKVKGGDRDTHSAQRTTDTSGASHDLLRTTIAGVRELLQVNLRHSSLVFVVL
jgi:hypothetical protein